MNKFNDGRSAIIKSHAELKLKNKNDNISDY